MDILSIYRCILIIAFIFFISCESNKKIEKLDSDCADTFVNLKKIHDGKTMIQRDEIWKKDYLGKWVNWQGKFENAYEIGDNITVSINCGTINYPDSWWKGHDSIDIKVILPASQKNIIVNLNKGDFVNFEGSICKRPSLDSFLDSDHLGICAKTLKKN